MNGMKEGAGDDPFADDEESSKPEKPQTGKKEKENSSPSTPISANPTPTETQTATTIPYIYRRDGVKESRDRYPLFLQEETVKSERQARRVFEDKFETNIPITDLREALLLAGTENLEDVEKTLQNWGYGIEFE